MKTRYVSHSTASSMQSTTASYRAKRRSRSEDDCRAPCERERKHEAHIRERQEQLKRNRAASSAALRSRQQQQQSSRSSQRWPEDSPRRIESGPAALPENPTTKKNPVTPGSLANKGKLKAKGKPDIKRKPSAAAAAAAAAALKEREPETERDQVWSEELLLDDRMIFEADVPRRTEEHQQEQPMPLNRSINSTTLGQLLKASQQGTNSPLLCPLAVALHSLVAEFLHAENYPLTLTMLCSEIPHRSRTPATPHIEFRFSQDDVKDVLSVLLGGRDTFRAAVQRSYYQEPSQSPREGQSLLGALLRVLMGENLPPTEEMPRQTEKNIQTEPAEEHETSRKVFVGPRLCESIHSIERRLSNLIRHMSKLTASCRPPVEIVTEPVLEAMLQVELKERERLLKAGQVLAPEKTAIRIPEPDLPTAQEQDDLLVDTGEGVIKLPVMQVQMPPVPRLFPQQIAFMATIRQSLVGLLRKEKQAHPTTMLQTIEKIEMFVAELSVSVNLLINVVNISMEQEYAVGRHTGFRAGYHEGFAHGHYMGVQEGKQVANEAQPHPSTFRDVGVQAEPIHSQHASTQTKKEKVQLQRDVACQTMMNQNEPLTQVAAVACQTMMHRETAGHVAVACQTIQIQKRLATVAVGSQTVKEKPLAKDQVAKGTQTKVTPATKTYEMWIHEMLHSASGKIFLERVELSLRKAYELQKKRLDDIYQVRFRHQYEMLHLHHRQSSWRTLCRRVQRDSHCSVEARELVQKIFNLLEHYEDHQKFLSAKIHETELAVEKPVRFMPPHWSPGQEPEVPNWTSAASHSMTTGTSQSSPTAVPPAAPMEDIPKEGSAPYSCEQMIPPPPAIVVVPPSQKPSRHTVAPNTNSSSPPQTTASLPQVAASPPRATASPPIPTSSVPLAMPFPPPQPMSFSYQAPAPAPEPAAPPKTSSFEDDLVSVKNRMQQLEQESDLLEQNFLDYLERARQRPPEPSVSGKQMKSTRRRFEDAAAVAKMEELKEQRTLTPEPDSYHFTNTLAVARRKLLGRDFEPRTTTSPARVSRKVAQVEEETQQILCRVRSEFTRTNHLLPEITSATNSSSHDDLDVLMRRAKQAMRLNEQPPARRPSIHLLDCSISSTLTSSSRSSASDIFQPNINIPGMEMTEMDRAAPPSTRLQQSMAKMQQLFGGGARKPPDQSLPHSQPQPPPRSTIRPVSAPTCRGTAGGVRGADGGTIRPHTAPTPQQQQPRQQQHQYFHSSEDVLLLSSSTCSSSAASSHRHYRTTDIYEGLVLDDTTHANHPVSPDIIHSRDFWKRLNL
ncbi:uncharacterized protein LOC108164823 [Drosophila miranda]|uniref:uncharacterized protein LOC108164823 n=1 Tax=Drosophila miranda TaxID=7229 RepID=UPI0007E6CFF3|nr:uncharacterized protein LOC108164823 [Drosophila miranda]